MKTIDTPINWKTRLGWTACAMPELLKNFVWDAFVLFFYAQVVGLNGVFIGAALLIGWPPCWSGGPADRVALLIG